MGRGSDAKEEDSNEFAGGNHDESFLWCNVNYDIRVGNLWL